MQSWYSGIMNWYVLHAMQESIDVIGTIQIILFFGHQCNSTLYFSRAFSEIIEERTKYHKERGHFPKRISDYYTELGRRCHSFRREEAFQKKFPKGFANSNERESAFKLFVTSYPSYEMAADVGCGNKNRFQTSNTKVLGNGVIKKYVDILLDNCNKMHERSCRQMKDVEKLHLVQFFSTELQVIPGVGTLKSQLLVQLCSLFGLVPLDYYTFLPIHLTGAPEKFMTQLMKWDKSRNSDLLLWNVQIVNELQCLYNKEFTFNMFENAACEIARKDPPLDLYYNIPTLEKFKSKEPTYNLNRVSINFDKKRLQFFFRVDGNRNNSWRLQMYAGGKNKINLFASQKEEENNQTLFRWTRAKSNGCLSVTTNVGINTKLLWKLDNVLI